MKILWIDDDIYRIRPLMERLVDFFGLEIEHFDNAKDGLDYLGSNIEKVDSIILDIMMPPGDKYSVEKTGNGRKTGELVYKEIREKYHYKGPILFYTVLRNYDRIKPYLQVDAKLEYLNKPIEPKEIVELLLTLSK